MSAFEFFFGFFSVIMGLAAATLAAGLADVLKSRQVIKVGLLTPLLAVFMLLDISTFWVNGWQSGQDIEITHATIYLGLTITLVYFLAASLVFPKDPTEWESLDFYYDQHRRLPLAGVLFCNLVGFAFEVVLSGGVPLAGGVRVLIFYACLVALMLVRNRQFSAGLLILLCLLNLSPVVLPLTAVSASG